MIAFRRCSNYIFILDLTPDFIGLGKDNGTMRRETFKFGDLVRLILDILQYVFFNIHPSPKVMADFFRHKNEHDVLIQFVRLLVGA